MRLAVPSSSESGGIGSTIRTLNSGFCISGPSEATSTVSPPAVVAVPGTMPTCGNGELLTAGATTPDLGNPTKRNVAGGIPSRALEASADELEVTPGGTE